MSANTLVNMIRTNFALIQHHNWSLTELEAMVPWEREAYVTMLMEWVELENEKRAQEGK